jgi:hypothetical protein
MSNAKRSAVLLVTLALFLGEGSCLVRAQEWPGNNQPRLEVTQKVVDQAGPGKPFILELLVRNLGTAAARSIRIIEELPEGAQLLEAAPSPSRQQNLLVWSLATLNSGERFPIRLHLRADNLPPTSRWLNKIRATYQTEVDNVSPIDLKRPELEVTVASPPSAWLGEQVPLEINVRNTGTWPGHRVILTALLQGGLRHESGVELENEIGDLPPGQSTSIALPLSAGRVGKGGIQLRLTAEDTAEWHQQLAIDVRDLQVDLGMHGPFTASSEWACTYDFVLSNQGSDALPATRLVAQMPKNLAFVRISGNGTYDARSHTVTWDLPECKPGESLTCVLSSVAHSGPERDGCLKVFHANHVLKEIPWNFRLLERPSSSPVPPNRQTSP